MTDEIKYCIDCKHLKDDKKSCKAKTRGKHLVTGEMQYHDAMTMRENHKACGFEARLFVAK